MSDAAAFPVFPRPAQVALEQFPRVFSDRVHYTGPLGAAGAIVGVAKIGGAIMSQGVVGGAAGALEGAI